MSCRYCGADETKTILGPHPGGHYSKILCANCERFLAWGKKPKELKAVQRREVGLGLARKFSRGFCELCLRRAEHLPLPQTLEGHHIIPVEQGGTDERSNVQILCTSCHRLVHHQRTYLGHYAANVREDGAA